jgi:hypothetical protein
MPDEPTLAVPQEVRELRLRLISEELDELCAALASGDLAGTADALARPMRRGSFERTKGVASP